MTQTFFIILILAMLGASLIALVLRDIYGPARITSDGASDIDTNYFPVVDEEIKTTSDHIPIRDTAYLRDCCDVDFGK